MATEKPTPNAAPLTGDQIRALVDEGASLDIEAKAKARRVNEIKAQLAKLAPGEYVGDSGRLAQVTQPERRIAPPDENVVAIRELVNDDSVFRKLFEHVAKWKPVKDFRAKAAVLLTAAKARAVLDAAEVDSVAYVIFK